MQAKFYTLFLNNYAKICIKSRKLKITMYIYKYGNDRFKIREMREKLVKIRLA